MTQNKYCHKTIETPYKVEDFEILPKEEKVNVWYYLEGQGECDLIEVSIKEFEEFLEAYGIYYDCEECEDVLLTNVYHFDALHDYWMKQKALRQFTHQYLSLQGLI